MRTRLLHKLEYVSTQFVSLLEGQVASTFGPTADGNSVAYFHTSQTATVLLCIRYITVKDKNGMGGSAVG